MAVVTFLFLDSSLSKNEMVESIPRLDTKIVIIHRDLPSPWRYARAALWCCNAATGWYAARPRYTTMVRW